jgi:hypothetical protein
MRWALLGVMSSELRFIQKANVSHTVGVPPAQAAWDGVTHDDFRAIALAGAPGGANGGNRLEW